MERLFLNILILAGWIAALPISAQAASSTQPNAGIYLVTSYVISASKACGLSAGTTVAGTFYYPGAGQTGAITHQPFNGNGVLGVASAAYPTTPLSGVTSWSGTATEQEVLNGASKTATFKFSLTLTFIDSMSFVATGTSTYANGCSDKYQSTYLLL